MMSPSQTGLSNQPPPRRWLLGALSVGLLALTLPAGALAAEEGKGGAGGHESGGGRGGEAGGAGGHEGGGGKGGEAGGAGGHEGGGGEGGGGNWQNKSPGQRAVRHRQQTGRTLGGGEGGGGHTGGSGHTGGGSHSGTETGEAGISMPSLPDGSTTGPIGGSVGGEHFVHPGTGGWGADTKVLRGP